MAARIPIINRYLLSLRHPYLFQHTPRFLHLLPTPPPQSPPLINTITHFPHHPFRRLFSSQQPKTNPKLVNFSLADADFDSNSDDEEEVKKHNKNRDLPPPYNPFDKKNPPNEVPTDPKNLQLIFHRMRTEGMYDNAVKMFDALSKDGLTHEALELFSQIKDKGQMPDVVAHTAVIEAYANAGGGKSKEALNVFLRMLASGVAPNAYTYTVLIKGLARDGKVGDAKKYLVEMMGKGMRPNVGTYTAVFEAFAREGKVEEGKELVVAMKEKGFVPDEKGVREALKNNRRGEAFRTVINILFDK